MSYLDLDIHSEPMPPNHPLYKNRAPRGATAASNAPEGAGEGARASCWERLLVGKLTGFGGQGLGFVGFRD